MNTLQTSNISSYLDLGLFILTKLGIKTINCEVNTEERNEKGIIMGFIKYIDSILPYGR